MDNISDILSSLSDEDMENLRAVAENLFSQDSGSKAEPSDPGFSMPDFSDLLGNAQMISKITSIMGAMNKKDDRTRLIEALKPLLSEKRRRKADEAMQMMKLMEMLPMITQIMGGDKR
jgi:hypothetical protein